MAKTAPAAFARRIMGREGEPTQAAGVKTRGMNSNGPSLDPLRSLRWYAGLVAAGWTLLVAALLVWQINRIEHHFREVSINTARTNFNKDQAMRYWAASHGGVYVPIDERTPPNPYLSHVPERDITTPSGARLTLMNPAYIVRQFNEYFSGLYGVRGHITSLKLHNPANKPDPWERKALEAFERGEKEILEFTDIGEEPYIRLMQPMMTVEGCLKCHGYQGYKVGEVRGGVSVSVPLKKETARMRLDKLYHLIGYGVIWLLGVTGVLFTSRGLGRRIEERARITDALRRSEERLRLTQASVDHAADAVFWMRFDGSLAYVNEAACRELGYSREELLNMSVPEFDPNYSPEIWREHWEMLRQRGSVTFESAHRDRQGRLIPVEITANFIRFGDEEYNAAFARDIRDRKRIERELRDSQAGLERAQTVAHMGSWRLDIRQNKLWWSPEVYRIFAVPPGTPLNYEAFLACVLPEDRGTVDAAWQAALKGAEYDIEHRIVADAQIKWVRERAELQFSDDGELLFGVGTVQDVSDRKQIEKELRDRNELFERLFATTHVMLAYLDRDFNFIRVNRAYADATHKTEEYFIGKNHFALYPHPENEKIFQQVVDTGLPYTAHDKGFVHPDQPERGMTYWDWTLEPVKDSAGRVVGLVFSLQDVTERRRAEEIKEAKLRYLHDINRVSGLIEGERDIDRLMERLVRELLEIFKADRAYLLYPCDPAAASYRIPYEATAPEYPGAHAHGADVMLDGPQAAVLGAVAAARGCVVTRFDEETLARINPEARRFMPRTILQTAVRPKVGGLWSVGLHQCGHDRQWTDDEKQLLEDIALKLAGAITNLQLRRDIEGSERKYRELYENSLDGIFLAGMDGALFDVNPSFCAMMGCLGPDDLRDRNLREMLGGEEAWRELVTSAREDGGMLETRLLRPGGPPLTVEINALLIRGGAGEPVACEGIVRDITRRRQAEREVNRLFRAIEQSAEMVLITGAEGEIVYANPAFERFSGRDRSDVVGQNIAALIAGGPADQSYREMWWSLARRRVWHGRITHRLDDGRHMEVDATVSPVLDSGGQCDGYVAVMRDVTGEAALGRAKDYFTAVTSHEMRTPLTKLGLARIMAHRLLQNAPSDEAVGKLNEVIDETWESFERVVSATELFSEMAQMRARAQFRQEDAGLLVMYAVEFARERARGEKRGVRVELSMEENVKGRRVPLEPRIFRRALDEVLSNAVKYTPDGRAAHVRVWLEEGWLAVETRDEGIGVPADKLEKVFDPFFSLENFHQHVSSQYKFKGGGIGMGLTLARLALESHGGTLKLESVEGQGTTVTMRLPLKAAV